jgi:signal transduction histidine kinase
VDKDPQTTAKGESDSRILAYRDAAVRLKLGQFPVNVPLEGADDVTRLGQAIRDLAETIERKYREMSELVRITEKVNAGLILDEVLDHVYASFHEIIPYDRIGFSLLEDDGRVLRARWARSASPIVRISGGYSAKMAGSSLEQVLRSGRPRIINDLAGYLAEHPGSESTRLVVEEGVRSSLTCPLVNDGAAIGFIFFSSFHENAYRDVHVELFMQIAGQLAAIVEKSRLYKELLELNEAKNRFLGIAAHDLRNPIGVVQSFARLLSEGVLGELNEQQKKVLLQMEHSCAGMLHLINDLLDVSAIESGQLVLEMKRAPLAPFLRSLVELDAMLAAGKGIELQLDIEGELPDVPFDERRMEQVVSNLVSNAVKFSEPGTVVRVSARLEIGETPGVVVSVADQGQGIPEEEVGHLFQDFSRTSVRPTRGEKSTGLGLSIVRRIVNAHGGRVWVESAVGKGSTFSFSIPVR